MLKLAIPSKPSKSVNIYLFKTLRIVYKPSEASKLSKHSIPQTYISSIECKLSTF